MSTLTVQRIEGVIFWNAAGRLSTVQFNDANTVNGASTLQYDKGNNTVIISTPDFASNTIFTGNTININGTRVATMTDVIAYSIAF